MEVLKYWVGISYREHLSSGFPILCVFASLRGYNRLLAKTTPVATGFTPGEPKFQASPEVNSVATKKKPKRVLNNLTQLQYLFWF